MLAVVAAFGWITAASADEPAPVVIDRIAAIVNKEVITLSDLQEALLQQASAGPGRPAAGDPAVAERVLTPQALQRELRRLIDHRLQVQAAEQHGLSVNDQELRQALEEIKSRNGFASDEQLSAALAAERLTLEEYRERLRREILTAKLVNREVRSRVVVSPGELRDYYTGHADEFSLPQRVKLRQIFLAAPAGDPALRDGKRTRGQELLKQLQDGADFALLARRYSDGPEAKEDGELGWFAPGSLMPELDAAAVTLKEGQLSGLIESPAGWHILRVEQREGSQQMPFEQAREALRERLMEEKLRQRYEEWALELRRKAYVDIRL